MELLLIARHYHSKNNIVVAVGVQQYRLVLALFIRRLPLKIQLKSANNELCPVVGAMLHLEQKFSIHSKFQNDAQNRTLK